ncbi:MAG: hypothetical protein FWB94_07710 [Chitinispirillia bacterium]|nr:hypothetical protein [Chitinispirillia bacterium]
MKIMLEKKIPLKKAEVFLSIERDVLRDDIRAYLNGKGYENQMLDRGIKKYLKSVGIYNENFELTPYGDNVMASGLFKTREMGKYTVWLDDKRIVLIERVAPVLKWDAKDPGWVALNDSGHFCLPTNHEPFYRFRILNGREIRGNVLSSANVVTEKIEIQDSGVSSRFEGELVKSVQEKNINENVEFPETSLLDMAAKIFQDGWNKNTRRYRVPLNSLKNDTVLEFFETNIDNLTWESYKVHAAHLPIEPYNREEAVKWRNILLTREITKKYLTANDFDSLVRVTNAKDGFAGYISALDTPNIKDYIKHEIKPNTPEFWHLQAPLDLSPDIPKNLVIDKFILAQDEKYTLRNIKKQIESAKVDAVFYYDKYVIKENQQRTAGIFTGLFDCAKKQIITDLGNKLRQNRYIATQLKDIKEVDIKTVFGNKAQHDRFVIYAVNGEIIVWNISSSTDYIIFPSADFNADTEGRVTTGVTFTKVVFEALDKNLRDYISKELKNV